MTITKWDLESAKKEALKYKSRSAFWQHSCGAANWLNKHDVLDEACSHMPENMTLKWDLQSVKTTALKYNHKTDFIENERGAYAWCIRNNKIDEICKHFITKKIKVNKINGTPIGFRKITRSTAKSSIQQFINITNISVDIPEELISLHYELLKLNRNVNIKFSELTLSDHINIASGYKTKEEYRINETKSFNWAQRTGNFNEVCKNLPKNSCLKWDLESAKKEALKYKTKGSFNSGSGGARNYLKRISKLTDICDKMPITRWDEGLVKQEISKYKTYHEFQKKAKGAYKWCLNNNKTDELCSGLVRRIVYNLEIVKTITDQYKTYTEFRHASRGAYAWSVRNKKTDLIKAYMGSGYISWNLQKVKIAILECDSISGFKKQYPGGNDYATRHGCFELLNEL